MAAQKQLVKAKKNWYPIAAPQIFNGAVIGESPVAEIGELAGRYLTVNLMTLTNDAKHQSVNIKFKIISGADNRALTEATGYETSPSAIKRLVRRDISRLDDSFVCETADKKQIRVKTVALTKTKTKSSVLKAIRKSIREGVALEAEKSDFENFLKSVIYHKLQMAIREGLKKIYPVKAFEVKKAVLLRKSASLIIRPKKVEDKEAPEQKEQKKVRKKTQESKEEPQEK